MVSRSGSLANQFKVYEYFMQLMQGLCNNAKDTVYNISCYNYKIKGTMDCLKQYGEGAIGFPISDMLFMGK